MALNEEMFNRSYCEDFFEPSTAVIRRNPYNQDYYNSIEYMYGLVVALSALLLVYPSGWMDMLVNKTLKQTGGHSNVQNGRLSSIGNTMTQYEGIDDIPGWKNLIPELLLGLVGCGGGAFVWNRIEDDSLDIQGRQDQDDSVSTESLNVEGCGRVTYRLELSENVDWVTSAEREQLNRIVMLGSYYRVLSEYANSHVDVLKEGSLRASMPYHAAVGQGLMEVLDVYRDAVVKLEECVVSADCLRSMFPLERAMSEFFELFPFLDRQVHVLKDSEDTMIGAEILHLFEQSAQTGIPIIEGCSERIRWHCYQVLCKQIYSWAVYGRLLDPSNDFFIHIEGVKGPQYSIMHAGKRGMNQHIRLAQESQSADILSSRIPAVVSLGLARDILYVGQYTRILDSFQQSTRGRLSVEDTFGRRLWGAFSKDFVDWVYVKKLVYDRKVELSEMVWNEMYAYGNIEGQIGNFVDLVLQNRGALYADLIERMNDSTVYSEPPIPERASACASCSFQEAMFHVGDTGESDHFSMVWYDVTNPSQLLPVWHPGYDDTIFVPSYDEWDGLCIEYTMQWPMHLVFPVKFLRQYGALWQLMFRLSRALYTMKTVRQNMRKSRVKSTGRKMVAMHHQLYHLLSTYAMFLQSEIVAHSSNRIHDILSSSSSLMDAELKHGEYLTDIVEVSCLDVKQVMGVLEAMFSFVKALNTLSTSGSDQGFDDIYASFLAKYNVFYQLLQSNQLQSKRRGEAIRRLLLKLNYNGFFDMNAQKQLTAHELYIS